MKSKRGVTQTQFNWIFIAIAGALILLFFISMVYKQKSIAEQKSDIEIQKNLQAILTGAEISKQTENIISVPEKEIRYDCEGFSIGSLAGFNPRIVFSPDLLKSNKRELILYSLEWRVPFRIVNFLYVTSPEIRYIIVDDDSNLNDESIANQLYDLLPENINKELVLENDNIEDKNNYKIKIIYFNSESLDLTRVSGDISKIKITQTQGELDGYGTISFDGRSLPYLKKESIVAAVFSENYDIYECNMEKAMTRLNKVYDVYKKRVKKLNTDEPQCSDNYDESDFKTDNKFDDDDIKKLYENIENLEDKNQITALYSCALIY